MTLLEKTTCTIFGCTGAFFGWLIGGAIIDHMAKPPAMNIAEYTAERTVAMVAREGQVIGTGVFISGSGHILTAAHVVSDTTDYMLVETYKDDIYAGEILFVDIRRDLALLKVGGWHPCVRLAGADLRLGEHLWVVGMPLGVTWTVTEGVAARLHYSGLFPDAMQISARVNPGNSGGPVVNDHGELEGILNYGQSEPNFYVTPMGFAISLKSIKTFLGRWKGLNVE